MSDKLLIGQAASRNSGAQSYRDLLAGQKSMSLAKMIYKITAGFPAEEKFGLISQLGRAAVSIPSNTAGGQARNTTGEFMQFISHADGSLAQLDTQFTLAIELNFTTLIKAQLCMDAIAELRRMLNGLRRAVTGQKSSARHSSPVTRH